MINTHSITKFIGIGLFFLGYWGLTNYLVQSLRSPEEGLHRSVGEVV